VLPFLVLAFAPWLSANATAWAVAAAMFSCLPRLIAVWKFSQTVGTALLHPVGVMALLVIQWLALFRSGLGRPAEWKGRSYGPVTDAATTRTA
jgi:hypothetical protein